MKDLLLHRALWNRESGKRLLVPMILSLVTLVMASELNAASPAVLSVGPKGKSQLNWVKPAPKETVTVESVVTETPAPLAMDVEEPAALETTESATEEPAALETVADETESLLILPEESMEEVTPIKPVNLIQVSNIEKSPARSGQPAALPATKAVKVASAEPVSSGVDAGMTGNSISVTEETRDTTYDCPDPKELSSIKDLSYKYTPEPGIFPPSCPLPDEFYVRQPPTPIVFTWKASAVCHKPLYFEDVQLERYGHTICPLLQPALSGARFWLTIPILPYLMGVNPPNECIYDLGYYRPGNCAPSMIEPFPISARGALMEAGAIVGMIHLIP